MDPFNVLRNLTAEQRAPIYFLYGPERFLVTEIVDRLSQLLVTDDNRDFNFEAFDGATSQSTDWINACRTLSFFGGDKLVVAHGIDAASWTDGNTASFLAYLKEPVAETCLVLTSPKADRKRKIYKALCALPGAIECVAPNEGALAPWLKQRAKSRGYNLTADGAERMVGNIGAQVGRLASELDKVLTYAGNNKSVGEDEVAEVVGDIRLETVFALTDALRDQNAQKALTLLHNQLDHGEEPLKLLGTVAWQFRMIWEVKHYQKQRMPSARIASAMGQRPFVIDKAARFTRNFSEGQLREGFRALARADRELKSTANNPVGVMETLVLQLCSGTK